MNTATAFETSILNPLPSGLGTFSLTSSASGVIINPTNSSAIECAHYLTERNTLVITYKSGKTYYYRQVPSFVVFNLMVAKSFGKFVNEHIKNNYEFWTN